MARVRHTAVAVSIMIARRPSQPLFGAALLAALAGHATVLLLTVRASSPLATRLDWLGWAQVGLAAGAAPYLYSAAALSGVALALGLERGLRRLLSGGPSWTAPLLCGWLLFTPLIHATGYAVMAGTTAWTPGETGIRLALASALLGPLARAALGVIARVLGSLHARCPRTTNLGLALFTAGAFALWWGLTRPLGLRYGATQLVSFALLNATVALVWMARQAQRARQERRAFALFGALLLLSCLALSVPGTHSARERYHAARPSVWFARVASLLLPDADGDGFNQRWGLLGGGDCDDRDARRHPGAKDLADNGVDENCFNGDLQAASLAPPARAPFERRSPFAAPFDVPRAHNIVLIVVDSLRFDRGFDTGFDPRATPTLARLAAAGTSYTNFRTCAPRTHESVADLLGVEPGLQNREAESGVERLAQAGVETAFIASSWLARYVDIAGFRVRRHPKARYGAFADEEVVNEIQSFLSERREPFFLFAHLLGAHEPYEGDAACVESARTDYARYRCALARIDREIARIEQSLTDNDLREDTLFVVTADHGEEFGEHGGKYHATTLYDEVLHVPLSIVGPGVSPAVDARPLSCHQLLETILVASSHQALAAADSPSSAARLGQVARSRRPHESKLFEPHLHAVIYRKYKLVFDRRSGVLQYWDLQRDPGELSPLAAVPAEVDRALRARLDAWLSQQVDAERPTKLIAAQ